MQKATVISIAIGRGVKFFKQCCLPLIAAVFFAMHIHAANSNPGWVFGWVANYYGQTNPPAGLNNAVAVSANGTDNGVGYSVALKSDWTITA